MKNDVLMLMLVVPPVCPEVIGDSTYTLWTQLRPALQQSYKKAIIALVKDFRAKDGAGNGPNFAKNIADAMSGPHVCSEAMSNVHYIYIILLYYHRVTAPQPSMCISFKISSILNDANNDESASYMNAFVLLPSGFLLLSPV